MCERMRGESQSGRAMRHVKGGALRLNDQPVSDDRQEVTIENITDEGVVKLSLGKKKHVLLRPV